MEEVIVREPMVSLPKRAFIHCKLLIKAIDLLCKHRQ